MRKIEEVLDLARWAPSGDNTQPWRFEILGDDRVLVHGFDTREHCVYDLDGRPSQLSIGALLETIRIAASGHRWSVRVGRRRDAPEAKPVFDVAFVDDPSITPSDLIPAIRTRCVQRRPMESRSIRAEEKAQLSASLPKGYTLMWLEAAQRWTVARLLFLSAKIRLTTREAYDVHSKVIEWDAQFSEDRIPDQAVGLDPLLKSVMKWAMRDWKRIWFLNTFLAGTLMPRVQLDFIPALACGAHALIIAPEEPSSIDDYVDAGAAVQRLWLTATRLQLQHQPELTPLIFSRYVRDGVAFTRNSSAARIATQVAALAERVVGSGELRRAVWMGRLGAGPPPRSRSLRLPLSRLLLPGSGEHQ